MTDLPADRERLLVVEGPYAFDESLRFVPFGLHDPTCARRPGQLWKAGHTPEGPATLLLARTREAVLARAWGEGAGWAIARADALAGLRDEPGAWQPPSGPLAELAGRWRGIHLPRSPWVLDGLVEFVLQQRVTFRDAARSHRRLTRERGARAPGPPGLLLPLAPAEWVSLGQHELRRAGVDLQRERALRGAARLAPRLAAAFDLGPEAARATLAAVPGCGPWTVEITLGFVLGEADAVPTGDLHLPHEVGWALASEPRADDRRMLQLLEPHRPHRFRLLRLLMASGHVRLGRSGPLR